ncbi:MAG: hypothetical protein EP344_11420 [Bacteroidetes bacterium]|nr:MAG: hypothetical protein EP344_11420 [Bacteroidota bacterium]
MASRTFEIHNYRIALGDRMSGSAGGINVNFRGYIACYGDDGYHLVIYFLNETSPVPAPTYFEKYKRGVIYIPFSQMAVYTDLIRNEKPVYAYVNPNHPEWNQLKTSQEPVGEGEE